MKKKRHCGVFWSTFHYILPCYLVLLFTLFAPYNHVQSAWLTHARAMSTRQAVALFKVAPLLVVRATVLSGLHCTSLCRYYHSSSDVVPFLQPSWSFSYYNTIQGTAKYRILPLIFLANPLVTPFLLNVRCKPPPDHCLTPLTHAISTSKIYTYIA